MLKIKILYRVYFEENRPTERSVLYTCTENNFATRVDELNFNFQTVIVENLFNSKFIFKGKQESNQLGVDQFTCLTVLLRDIYTRVFQVRVVFFAFRLSDSSRSAITQKLILLRSSSTLHLQIKCRE